MIDYLDTFVQRTVEHGFKKYFQKKSVTTLNNLPSTDCQTNDRPQIETIFTSTTLDELEFLFFIYLFGILFSGLTFAIELFLVGHYCKRFYLFGTLILKRVSCYFNKN